jgi:hypothetical protein
MCNAYNHPSDCSCGFGGDTGGGYSALAVASGAIWNFECRPSLASYVNRNAVCPICGATVFFYQSPHGGRVFFDDLGPPWPKHPCTDTWLSNGIGSVRNNSATSSLVIRQKVADWKPLLAEMVQRRNKTDWVYLSVPEPVPGRFIRLPADKYGHGPVFWRRVKGYPEFLEVSIVDVDAHNRVSSTLHTVEAWLDDEADVLELTTLMKDETSASAAEILNEIGYKISLYWREMPGWPNHPSVNLTRAIAYFRRAAKLGSAKAKHNLAIMYRNGLGVPRDARRATRLFKEATRSLTPPVAPKRKKLKKSQRERFSTSMHRRSRSVLRFSK